jgi:ZIP family zinc transporter/zinc and cadmium transporter
MSNTAVTLFYGLLAGVATITGIQILILKKSLAKRYASYLMPFAAGVLLAVAFFHLIPESLELNENSILFVFIGFIIFYLMESFLFVHAGPELHHIEHFREERLQVSGQVAFVGLFLHSLIDGVIIVISFEIDRSLGIFTALGIILHELPEGITTFSLLIIGGQKKDALIKSYLVALATPAGTIISLLFIKSIPEPVIGILLALVSGTFIYVAASDLIPQTHNNKGFANSVILLSGVLVIYLMSFVG